MITGGLGFIGSNLVDRLLADGHAVTAYDNVSTGQIRFLDQAKGHKSFRLVEGDVLDEKKLAAAVAGHDFIFHFAANADVRFGTEHPRRDLEQNTIATYNVLEAMRAGGVKSIAWPWYVLIGTTITMIVGMLSSFTHSAPTGGDRWK